MADKPEREPRTKIAIACQGGGSQTAFTAGVLSALLEEGVHRDFEIVTLSGTSGGAICATLVWSALCREEAEPWSRLEAIWEANTAQTAEESAFNWTVVEAEGSAFWDGLFSDNPPVAETIMDQFVGRDGMPDEIWIIKINPTRIAEVPTAPEEISTRRNQLIGNISLFQQLHSIEWLNDLQAEKAFRPEFLERLGIAKPIRLPRASDRTRERPWHIPFIEISPKLQEELDYESKLDRDPETIHALMADGAARARRFLEARKDIGG